jgi:peptide/nickel transport system permease protein
MSAIVATRARGTPGIGRAVRHLVGRRDFAIGGVLLAVIIAFVVLSFFSPYPPDQTYVLPPDMAPAWPNVFGTDSRGQDVFFQVCFAIRNTLAFGLSVALISRVIAICVGMISGYMGGFVDRVLMSINDVFVVIPLLPVLVLFYFVMKNGMSWGLLALVMAGLGWAYDARLIRSVTLGLRTREFTRHAIFSGMTMPRILLTEHLPFVLPIIFSTTLNNMIWSIGMEVTLSVLGFTNVETPTVGTMIYWANQHQAMVSGDWWWIAAPVATVVVLFVALFLLAVSLNEYVDPRLRTGRGS